MNDAALAHRFTKNQKLTRWVADMAALCEPARIHWCDGSQAEYDRLCAQLVDAGTFIRLNPAKRPNSYLARSDPRDVARVEDRTFICSSRQGRRRPDQQLDGARGDEGARWASSSTAACGDARCMSSRSAWARSARPSRRSASSSPTRPTSSVNMRIMTRMGAKVLDVLGDDGDFVPCLHSVGVPLATGAKDVPWPCNPDNIVHRAFPRDARDLVLRQRLRRQRAARQEMPGAAHRLGHGARRRLARRAHADRRRRKPAGREDLCRRPRSPAPAARPTSR